MKRLGVVFALVAAFSLALAAETPLDVVKSHIDGVISVLVSKKLSVTQKKRRIMEELDTAIDWPYVSKLVLGIYYKKCSPGQFSEFERLFKEFVKHVYARKFLRYSGERIIYKGQRVEDGIAVVDMVLVTTKGQKIPIACRLSKRDGRWLIYDVLIEGISMVNNYRIQINRIISKKGVNGLLRILRRKVKRMEGR